MGSMGARPGSLPKRIRERSTIFRISTSRSFGGAAPRDPDLSGGISCYEVAGIQADEVVRRLAARRIRTTTSPYKISYARVSAGVMNSPGEIDTVLREIRALSARAA